MFTSFKMEVLPKKPEVKKSTKKKNKTVESELQALKELELPKPEEKKEEIKPEVKTEEKPISITSFSFTPKKTEKKEIKEKDKEIIKDMEKTEEDSYEFRPYKYFNEDDIAYFNLWKNETQLIEMLLNINKQDENTQRLLNKNFKIYNIEALKQLALQIKKKGFNEGRRLALVGEEGTGKTSISLTFTPPIIIVDCENRVELLSTEDDHFKSESYKGDVPRIILRSLRYNESDRKDGIATLNFIRRHEKIIKHPFFNTISFDSISELRSFATDEWLYEKNKTIYESTTKKEKKYRIRPAPIEYGEINDKVEDIISPYINNARINGKNLILTIQLMDDYVNEKKVGRKPAAKEFILHNIDEEWKLEESFNAYCKKYALKSDFYINFKDKNFAEYTNDIDKLKELIESYSKGVVSTGMKSFR